MKNVSTAKYGTAFRLTYNPENSFAVAFKQEKATAQNPNPLLQFFIFDMREKKIVFEDKLAGGKINWKNNNQVEAIFTPEMISTEENNKIHGYIYDVKLKTKKNINLSTQNSNL